VRRSLGRVNTLVQDMLDYSKARTVEKRRVDINALLKELYDSFADEFAKQRVRCHLVLDEALKPLMLDADGLEKALVNLIVNATQSLPEADGAIWLRTWIGEGGETTIEIEDNGTGIPKEILGRIFVPFFTTKGSKGSGLGLAMTKKFVEDMGGRIDVQSTESEGTCFRITLESGSTSASPSKKQKRGDGESDNPDTV
jgi:signal transduction histidine kinase